MVGRSTTHRPTGSTEDSAGLAKATLFLGEDTVHSLDQVVKRGHFAGRGRALDALLDSLRECVEDLEYWELAFRHYSERGAPREQVRTGQNEMIAHVDRVRTRLGRFFAFKEWDSPMLPWEEDLERKGAGHDKGESREHTRSTGLH